MRVLTVTVGHLELARAHLRKPFVTVGRSPSCDVLLRAPGIQAIHFLIEWIGSGEFDPDQGMWSITNISKNSEEGQEEGGETGEGLVFSQHPVKIGGFTFACIFDRLESGNAIGGGIVQGMKSSSIAKSEILELIQVRTDSGAIEEVRHVPVRYKKKKERLLAGVKQFKIEWNGGKKESSSLLRVILEEMPDAEIFNRGQRLQFQLACDVRLHDILRIRWRNRDFYIRLVDQVKSPPVPRDLFGDALLRKLLLSVALLGAFLMLLLRLFPSQESIAPKNPPRVARVEIAKPIEEPQVKETPKPEVIPQPLETPKVVETAKPVAIAKPNSLSMERPIKVTEKAHSAITASGKKEGKATAPRFNSNQSEVKPGLSSAAKVTDVNSVGILATLNKMGPKGKGVRADLITNDASVTESISGAGASKVVVRNPPAGTLGSGTGGSPEGTGSELGSASTTLAGAGKYDAGAAGAVAVKGGASGYHIGTGGSGNGSSGTATLGSLSGGDFTVEGGGLDRESVKRIISSHRGEIRTCYERALLTQNNLDGRIVYDWRIGSDGVVVSVQMTKTTVASTNLSTCVQDVIQQMVFPPASNGKSTRVIYPFVFQGRK